MFNLLSLAKPCNILSIKSCFFAFLLPVCLSVMNLDRLENHTHVRRRFPRYHTTLFRAQALWDPYTHVTLPPAALVPQRQQQHSWKEKERTEKERKNRHTNRIKDISGEDPRKYNHLDFSISASTHQSAASAPVSISANQTKEYTAAKRSVSLPEPPITIVILLIYRSLGAALPPKYHADRRGVRWEISHS